MTKDEIALRMMNSLCCDVYDAGPQGAVYECAKKDKPRRKAFKIVRKHARKSGYDARLFTTNHGCKLIVRGGPDVSMMVKTIRRRLTQ